MKQTAIEWLVNEIPNIDWENSYWKNRIEQAKEMEKQQIKDAWLNSLTKGDYNSAEQYYNEKYNK